MFRIRHILSVETLVPTNSSPTRLPTVRFRKSENMWHTINFQSPLPQQLLKGYAENYIFHQIFVERIAIYFQFSGIVQNCRSKFGTSRFTYLGFTAG